MVSGLVYLPIVGAPVLAFVGRHPRARPLQSTQQTGRHYYFSSAYSTPGPGGVISIYPYLGGHANLVATGATTITATLDSGESGSAKVTVVP